MSIFAYNPTIWYLAQHPAGWETKRLTIARIFCTIYAMDNREWSVEINCDLVEQR